MKYTGPQTNQARENFPFPYRTTDLDFIYALAEVKKAAALAHKDTKELDSDLADAIVQSCDEIIEKKHDTEFPLSALQGGAGTSIHMNVNEVVAARGQEILKEQGTDKQIHPNDHVNMSQSTNDANPSALRILCIRLSDTLLNQLDLLEQAFRDKAAEYPDVPKLARTHIQDAVPTTVAEEMHAYAAIINKNNQRLEQAKEHLFDLNLGGTAVGNSINASDAYRQKVYEHLKKITRIPVREAENLMAGTSSAGDFCFLSGAVFTACTDISKIAKDIRVLSSGPRGGIGEFTLEPLQPGSSIMPGKINPVLPEAVNQLFYMASGYNITIHQATHGANLELNVMFPIIADSLITLLKVTTSVIQTFREKCIEPLKVNKQRCRENLEQSTAYATLLTPVLGYDTVSSVVKTAVAEQKSIREVILEKEIMTEGEFEKAIRV